MMDEQVDTVELQDEPIYQTKDGQTVTKSQLTASGYDDDRVNKGLQNGILKQVGDTKNPDQVFKTKDGQQVTTRDLLASGYSQERIDKGIHNGILSPHFEGAPVEKKNPSEKVSKEPSVGGLVVDGTTPKTRAGSIDFEASSLEAGNDLSKSNVEAGKEIPPAKNSLELVGEINDLSKVGTVHVSGGTGGAAAGFSQSPDAYKKSQENYTELKGRGLKDKDIAEIKNDLSDLSPEVQGLSVTDKDGKVSYPYSLKSLGELRDVDPIAYKTKLNAVKTYDVIRRTAGIEKANEFSRLQNQNQAQLNQYTDIEDFNRKKEKQKEIIRQTLKGDDRDIAMQRVDENSAIILNDAIPDSKSAEDYLNNRLYQSKGTLSKKLTLHDALMDSQDAEFTGNVNDFKLESIQSKLDPNNPADQIAFAKYKRGVNLNNALSHSGNLDEAALNFASSEDDHLAATIKTINAGGQELPNSYKGEIVANFLNDPEIIAKAQDDPEFAKEYTKTAQNLYFNYPDFAKTEIGNIISQAREDEGYNNWFANVPTKGGTDKLVDKLVADGKMTELQKNIYLRDIAPELGVGKSILRGTGHILAPAFTDNSPIATPDLLTHAGEGWDNTMGGLYKSLKMATRIPTPTNLMPTTQSNGEVAMDLLDALKNEKENTVIQPKGLLHKASAASGDFIPLVVSMAVGGGMLKGAGKAGEAINMALQFAGNNAEKALVAFPDSPLKQKMYTGAATSIDMFLGRLLPHNKALSQEVSNSIRKDITGVISDFASEKITADAAKKTILNRIEDLVTKKAPEILKANTETGAIMAAFSAGHNGLDIAFGAKPPQSVEDFAKETAQAFETGFLGNTLVAAAMAGKNTATVKDNLLKASANPEHYIEQIKIAAAKNPEIAKQQEELINNVNVAVEARKVADAKGMNEKQAEDFILLHVAQGVQENTAKNATVDLVKEEATKQAKDLKARKEKVYGGEVDTKLSVPIDNVDEIYDTKKQAIEDKLNQQLEDNKDRLDDIADKDGTKTIRQKIYQEHTNDMVELEKWKMKEDLKNEKLKADKPKKDVVDDLVDFAENNLGKDNKVHPTNGGKLFELNTERLSNAVKGLRDKIANGTLRQVTKAIQTVREVLNVSFDINNRELGKKTEQKIDDIGIQDAKKRTDDELIAHIDELESVKRNNDSYASYKDTRGDTQYMMGNDNFDPYLTEAVNRGLVEIKDGKLSRIKDKASNGGGDVVIEKKNTGTEIEPDLGEGRKPVTLSGSTEAERQVAIEQRKKETKQTPMTSERDALLERIQKFNKLSRSQKRASYGEVNKIKVALDKFNKGNEQQHSITTNRDGSLDLRGNPTDKRPSGKPIRYTLKGNENSIIDNAVTLTERDLKTKEVFKELLDADVLPVSRRINGEKMSEAEHDATIQDILDGIPSQRAENYLNSLEKQIREDNFDFGNPDKNIRTTLNDALGITTERGEPMTADAVEKWLKDESELTKEDEILFDNIENLITHYEQLHESESGTPAKVQQPIGKGQESNSGKANENEQPKSETSTANKKEPIKNEEAQAQVTQDTKSTEKTGIAEPVVSEAAPETKAGEKEPPKEPAEPVGEGEGKDKLNDKGILNHLESAKNVPDAAKEGFRDKGLKYETKSQKEAEDVAKSVIDEYGIEDAVLLAEAQKFDGDVNSLIYAESLNRLAKMEDAAKTPEEKLAFTKQFAEIGIKYDEAGRKGGRFSSAINYFYKKSPLGVQMIENAKRKEDFESWAKPKDKSWKEFFDEMVKEPEFDAIVKEQVKEGMKQERAEARAARIKKVDDFFDKAKDQFKGGAMYSTIIPPKVITTALEGMKKAYHAGEKVAKLVEDAIDYISNELGGASWDKDKFRKEWEEKLHDKTEKKKLTDEEVKAKILDRFRNKLKGLTDKQKEAVVRKSFAKIVESGGLDYADFRKIIADVTGKGEMTDAEAVKLRELVTETNAVDDAGNMARTERTQAAREAFRETEKKAGKAQRALNELLYNKPNITKRLTSLMQLNTLGIPALVNNPVYNVVNQLGLRTPVGLLKTGLDKAIYYGAKAFGKEILPETNILSVTVQKEFFKKLGLGTRESVGQFLTGLNRMDYLNKEIQGQQIRPATAMRDLWAYSKGEKNLTRAQVIDKVIQASPPGITAEIIARTLNLGDKPQRFAAEGAQAAAFAKSLGLKDIDYDLFIDFPREEAYMQYKKKGWSDAKAAEQADYIRDTIVKEGERSTFQQDNFANDILNRIFGGKDSGVGGLAKATVISPYIKIPTNAFWSYYNIVNPEMAMLQSMVYAGKAYAKTKGVKFDFDKHNSSAKKDLNEAKYWLAHAAVGMATRAVIMSLVGAGVFRSGNSGDDTKKEREGEQFYEDQGTVNVSKLFAIMKGEDPTKVQNGLVVKNKWFGHWGTVGNTIAKKYEDMTPEQKANNADFWDVAIGGMELEAMKDLNQGVFGNTSSLLGAINQGVNTGSVGSGLQSWGVNTLNMFTNTVHPAASAQIERAALPYYTKQKADTFYGELKNTMLARSAVLRKLSGQYPPSKVGIWGDRLDKKENMIMSLFGFSHNNPDNFAQPIYEDYKKTNNTKYFPPAVMPTITDNGVKVKLPTADAARFEQLVGQQRKKLVAPYINDMATFEGSGKVYSKLTPDEKLDKLDILYEEGYNNAKYLFLKEKPQYKVPVKSGAEKIEDKQDRKENKTFRSAIKKKAQSSNY